MIIADLIVRAVLLGPIIVTLAIAGAYARDCTRRIRDCIRGTR